MRGRKSRGCRGWHLHPAENPFARNRGWLSAVVTLSPTGDAACGLHKQRLRHMGYPREGERGGGGGCSCGMGMGPTRVAVAVGRAANVMLRPLVVFNPTPFVHSQQRETPRRTAWHLSPASDQAGSLLPASPVSCRHGRIRWALKDAPSAKRQRAFLPVTPTPRRTDRCLSALRFCHRDPDGKTLRYILPTKVQTRLPRLPCAYAPALFSFRLHDWTHCFLFLFHFFMRGSRRWYNGNRSPCISCTTASINVP